MCLNRGRGPKAHPGRPPTDDERAEPRGRGPGARAPNLTLFGENRARWGGAPSGGPGEEDRGRPAGRWPDGWPFPSPASHEGHRFARGGGGCLLQGWPLRTGWSCCFGPLLLLGRFFASPHCFGWSRFACFRWPRGAGCVVARAGSGVERSGGGSTDSSESCWSYSHQSAAARPAVRRVKQVWAAAQ